MLAFIVNLRRVVFFAHVNLRTHRVYIIIIIIIIIVVVVVIIIIMQMEKPLAYISINVIN